MNEKNSAGLSNFAPKIYEKVWLKNQNKLLKNGVKSIFFH